MRYAIRPTWPVLFALLCTGCTDDSPPLAPDDRIVAATESGVVDFASQAGNDGAGPACGNQRLEFTRVEVGAVTLHVGCQGERHGGKPSIIFLHGFPEHWESWAEVASILAMKFQVVLPDQRGYNLSDRPLDPSDYELQDLVGDVAGLIAAFSPNGPVVLVGHDLGGLIAYAAASLLPTGAIAGLVVVNAPHPNVFQQLFSADLARFPPPTGQLAASHYIPTFFPAAACPLPGFCPHDVPEAHYSNPDHDFDGADPDAVDYANLTGLITDWGGAALVTQRLFDAWNRTPGPTADTHLTSMLNWYRGIVPLLFTSLPDFHVNVPTLVLWGRQDVVLVEANVDLGTHPAYPGVQTLDEFIPDLEVRTFADAGHFLQHEETIEVARAIKQFVDAVFARLAAHVGGPSS